MTKSLKPTFSIEILGDDELLYSSNSYTWEDGCQEVTLTVSNVKQLRITVKWNGGVSGDYERLYLGNDTLFRVLTDEDFADFL